MVYSAFMCNLCETFEIDRIWVLMCIPAVTLTE